MYTDLPTPAELDRLVNHSTKCFQLARKADGLFRAELVRQFGEDRADAMRSQPEHWDAITKVRADVAERVLQSYFRASDRARGVA